MKFLIQVLVATFMASTAAGIHISHDLEDGLYTAHLDNDTTVLVKRSVAPPSPEDFVEHVPLPSIKTRCGGRYRDFRKSQYEAAALSFFDQRLFTVPPRSVQFSLYGNSVAYVCNYNDAWNSASLLEFSVAMDKLDSKCGQISSGAVNIRRLSKAYGRDVRGWPICPLGHHTPNPDATLDSKELRRAFAKCDSYVRKSCKNWSKGPY